MYTSVTGPVTLYAAVLHRQVLSAGPNLQLGVVFLFHRAHAMSKRTESRHPH